MPFAAGAGTDPPVAVAIPRPMAVHQMRYCRVHRGGLRMVGGLCSTILDVSLEALRVVDRGDSGRPMVRISDFPPGDNKPWPRSHGVYNVTVSIPIVAHSQTQAKKRAGDIMRFLAGWCSHEDGPRQASLYLYDDATIVKAEHSHDDTYESRDDIGINMFSNREFIFDWLDPRSDADYDPFALAEKTYFCFAEDEEE